MRGLDASTTDRREARHAALSGAADALDAELARAPVDDRFILVLQACAHAGHGALLSLCDKIDKPSQEPREVPALALADAVSGEPAAARALRAATWVIAAQRIAVAWPDTWFDVLGVAQEAIALDASELERVRELITLMLVAQATEDAGDRDGMRFQFSRQSLEDVIAAATGRRPVRRDMIHVIPHWTGCVIAGFAACDEHLRAASGA